MFVAAPATNDRMLSKGWLLGGAALALAAAACGNNHGERSTAAGSTGGTGSGGGGTGATGAATTTGSGGSTATGTGGGSAVCTPTAGSAVIPMGCDLLQLAVMDHGGGASSLSLTGRLFGETAAMPKCASIDGVDILTSGAGSSVVQHLAGGLAVALDSQEELIAQGTPPVADIEGRCASDDPQQRFDVYGILITGRVDGGTFQAECARAEGGGHWPPALRVTCHKNVDAPAANGNVSVMTQTFMGTNVTTAQLFGTAPHALGGALQTLDSTLHVIPQREPFDPGQPIPSHDTTGWMTAVSETAPPSAPASQLSFFAGSNPLGSDLCPPAPSGPPGPGTIAPPVFLARVTGTGQHGPFSTELFVTQCYTASIP